MDERGSFAPETGERASERYASLGRTAQVVVRAVAKAMDFDEAEYEERVTPAVVETARDVLLGQELRVLVGSRAEYDSWLEERDLESLETGSDNVENVAWHPAPFAGQVAAATFQNEPEAAVETVRRQAVGRIYRERLVE